MGPTLYRWENRSSWSCPSSGHPARLLLLEAPAAGLNMRETEKLSATIRRIPERGMTVMLVDHDMSLVMGIPMKSWSSITGRRSPKAFPGISRKRREVISAYLGEGGEDAEGGEPQCLSGALQALRNVSLHVNPGEMVALLGANGAGKTTLMKIISGLHPLAKGRLLFNGQKIAGLPAEWILRLGVGQVPEGRQIFAPLTVLDNLVLGGYVRFKGEGKNKFSRTWN